MDQPELHILTVQDLKPVNVLYQFDFKLEVNARHSKGIACYLHSFELDTSTISCWIKAANSIKRLRKLKINNKNG